MEWTWQQRLKFFMLGAAWAALLSLAPVGVTLWDELSHYSDPVDWLQIKRLTAACVFPAIFAYWRKHKAELQVPPGLVIPPEFRPAPDEAGHISERSPANG